jgi:integrase
VVVAVYTGARRSEVEALRWEEHIDLENGWVFIPGTKTAGSCRKVPLPGPLGKYLSRTPLKAGPVVEAWQNVGRDLPAACARVGIPPATPNDLRRTYASWMKHAGEDSAVVAKLLGHSSTRMVDLVYGRLTDENLVAATKALPKVSFAKIPNAKG